MTPPRRLACLWPILALSACALTAEAPADLPHGSTAAGARNEAQAGAAPAAGARRDEPENFYR